MAGKPESTVSLWIKTHPWFPAGVVLLSLLSVSSLNDPATLPRTLFWSLLLLGWVLWLLSRRKKGGGSAKLPLPVMVCMGLTLLAHLVSLTVAINPLEGVLVTLRMVLLFSGVWLISTHLKAGGDKARSTWIMAIWVAGTLQACIALIQFATDSSKPPAGTEINPNLLGTLVTLSLPCAGWLLFKGSKALRIAAGVSFALTLPAIYFSESRAALLMLLVFSLLLVFYGLSSLRFLKGSVKALVISGTIIGMCVSAVVLYVGWGRKEMPLTYNYLWNNSSQISKETSSIEVRMVLWNKSMQMGKAHPITGVGAGNWKLVAPSYGIKGFDETGRYGNIFYIRPHNDFIWIFAETGWPGLLGYFGFFGVLIFYGLKKREGKDRSINFIALLGISGYMVDSFFSFPLERIENIAILGFYAALLIPVKDGKSGRWKNIALIKLAVLLPLTAFLAAYRLPMDAATHKMRTAKLKKQYDKVLKLAESADDPWNRYEAQTATPYTWYKAMAMVEKARALGPSNPQYVVLLNSALTEVNLALEDAPHNLNALSELGSTYAQLGRFPEAVDAYKNLTATFPDNEEGWINLAVCYYSNKQNAEAQAALTHVNPASTDANYQTLMRVFGSSAAAP